MKAITIVLGSALITAAALKVGPALAEPARAEIVTAKVVTSDLDLTTPSGARLLETRLAQAAREVCGQASDFDVVGKNEVRACRSQVLAEARANRDTLMANKGQNKSVLIAARR